MIKNKIIWVIDILLVGAVLLAILWLIGYTNPQVISPIDNLITEKNSVLFSVGSADYILIDDNLDFSSPETVYVKDNSKITLEPGVYYWKIRDNGINEIRTLTILSKIDLGIVSSGDFYEIVNYGNINLNVEVYDENKKVGDFELQVLESQKIDGNKFIGGQNE